MMLPLRVAKVPSYPIFEQWRHDVTPQSLHNRYSRLGAGSYQHGGGSAPPAIIMPAPFSSTACHGISLGQATHTGYTDRH